MKATNKALKTAQSGQLIKLNNSSDVYKVIEIGCTRATLKNMYTGITSEFKFYTKRGGLFHDRTVEVVEFY